MAESETFEHTGPTRDSIETAALEAVEQSNCLRRHSKAHHVSRIAVGIALATRLIIGTDAALVRGGPANLLIAYCIVGPAVFVVYDGHGRVVDYAANDNGFGGYATRFVDPAPG